MLELVTGKFRNHIASCTAVFAASSIAIAKEPIRVSNVYQLFTAISDLHSGTTLELQPGYYSLKKTLTIKARGTKTSPIQITGAVGGVFIVGPYGFQIYDSTFVKILNLEFSGTYKQAIQIRDSSDITIAGNTFALDEKENGPKADWLRFKGSGERQRVLNNFFRNKRAYGRFLYINRGQRHTLIKGNRFVSSRPRVDNGKDCLVIRGYFTTVEHNYFEDCSGEAEIISVKAIWHKPIEGFVNVIRDNIFVNNQGTVNLRQANKVLVERNLFYAQGQPNTGGIKIYGDDHVVRGNRFVGLSGTKQLAPIALMQGAQYIDLKKYGAQYTTIDPSQITEFPVPRRVQITGNTFIDTSPVILGYKNKKRPLPTEACSFTGNRIVSKNSNPILVTPGQVDLKLDNLVLTSQE